MVKPISTFGQTAVRNANLRQLEADLAIAETEVSTLRKNDVSKSLGTGLLSLQDIRNQRDEDAAYQRSIDVFKQRYELMDSALDQTTKAVEGLLEVAAINSGDPLDSAFTINQLAEDTVDAIRTALNISLGGRQLFSGAAVDTAPIRRADDFSGGPQSPQSVVAAAIAGTSPGGPTTLPGTDLTVPATQVESEALLERFRNIFDGTNFGNPAPDPDFSFENVFFDGELGGTLADIRLPGNNFRSVGNDDFTDALRDIFQGAWIMASVDLDSMTDDAAYQTLMNGDGLGVRGAINLIADGLETIREVRAEYGSNYQLVDNAEENLAARKLLFDTQINALEGVNPAEASSILLNLENQLQVSYQATSRVIGLSLFNFVR